MVRVTAIALASALVLASCAGPEDGHGPGREPAYLPTDDAAQAPLLGGATVTGDLVRDEQ